MVGIFAGRRLLFLGDKQTGRALEKLQQGKGRLYWEVMAHFLLLLIPKVQGLRTFSSSLINTCLEYFTLHCFKCFSWICRKLFLDICTYYLWNGFIRHEDILIIVAFLFSAKWKVCYLPLSLLLLNWSWKRTLARNIRRPNLLQIRSILHNTCTCMFLGWHSIRI